MIQEVAQQTQEELKYHISEIVTLALAAVFDKPYQFEVDFVQRRNQTEADLWFVRDGERIDPLTASGGGAVDVASFALRASLWALQRNRPILILDEPGKFISKTYQPKFGEMLQMISKRLSIQILFITHCDDLVDSADRIFEVSIRKGVSVVKTI